MIASLGVGLGRGVHIGDDDLAHLVVDLVEDAHRLHSLGLLVVVARGAQVVDGNDLVSVNQEQMDQGYERLNTTA